MHFKINKAQPRIVVKSKTGDISLGKPKRIETFQGYQSEICQLRENSLKKDNWNLYVGDVKYKTNFFLQFKNQFTKNIYQKHLYKSSLYSLRAMLIVMSFCELFLFGKEELGIYEWLLAKFVTILLSVLSFLATTKISVKLRGYLQWVLIVNKYFLMTIEFPSFVYQSQVVKPI